MRAIPHSVGASWPGRSAAGAGGREAGRGWTWQRLAALFGFHGALGLAMHQLPPLATIHSVAAVAAVLAVSLYSQRPGLLLLGMCYVSGSEVLWRMSKAFLFHETAKYVIVLICAIGLVRLARPRVPGAMVLYLGLLLPSAIITYYSFGDFNFIRRSWAFALSGPLAITATVCYCSNLRLKAEEVWHAIIALAAPLVGVAAVTLVSTYWREGVQFSTESNFATSGGFGPNQVASALALGALLILLGSLLFEQMPALRALFLAVAVVFAVQSAMTFSRGGIFATAFSLALVSPLLLTSRRQRVTLLVSAVVLAALAPLVYAGLNRYTGGKLQERFADTDMTGREDLLMTDLAAWEENPVFGVGLGISRFYHKGGTLAHTEFSRALAESGSLGALAYIVFCLVCVQRALVILGQSGSIYRPLLLAVMIWSALYMLVNANRTSAPALAMGLAFVTIQAAGRGGMAPSPGSARKA